MSIASAVARKARQMITGLDRPLVLTAADEPRLAGTSAAGLYMHIPFCRTLCPYCPYNKVPYDASLARTYGQALLQEITLTADRLEERFESDSLYIGGGTPTLCMDLLAEAIDAAKSKLQLAGEICIETGPDACEADTIDAMKDVGISMVSLGVQSLHPPLLKALGRRHSPDQLTAAISRLLAGGFDALNCDFLFAMPGLEDKTLLTDLERAIELGVEQITLYPLFTFPYSRVRNYRKHMKVRTPNLWRRRRQFNAIRKFFRQAGWTRSSIWSFRRTGVPKFSSATRDRYIGLGAGAGSYTNWGFTLNTFDVNAYNDRLREGKPPTALEMEFTPDMHRCFWLYWRLYDTRVSADALDEVVTATPRLARFWRLARLAGWIRRVGETYVLAEAAAFWMHLVQNRYILADINTVWTQARAEAFPARIRL